MEGFASAVLLVSMCMCGQVSVHMNSLEEINENVLGRLSSFSGEQKI